MVQRFSLGLFTIVILTVVLLLESISPMSIEERGSRQHSRTNSRTRPTADLMNGIWARIGKRYNTYSEKLTKTQLDEQPIINGPKALKPNMEKMFNMRN